jgi:hypothetical protein
MELKILKYNTKSLNILNKNSMKNTDRIGTVWWVKIFRLISHMNQRTIYFFTKVN